MNWVVCANVNRTWDFLSSPESTRMRKLSKILNSTSSKSLHEAFQRIKLKRVERESWMKCALRELRYCPTGCERKMENFTMSTSTEWTRPSQSERERKTARRRKREKILLCSTHNSTTSSSNFMVRAEREGQFQQLFFSRLMCVHSKLKSMIF